MSTVLVLGGYGAVGAHLTAALRTRGHRALTAGRDSNRADVPLDINDSTALRAAADQVDVVVNGTGREDPDLIATIAATGTPVLDVSADTGYLAALEHLSPAAPVLLSVGIAPGLTNLLAHAIDARHPGDGPLDIAIVLGTGEAHGAAASAWTYGLLGREFTDPDGSTVRNLTVGDRFDLDGDRRTLYRADFSDQHTTTRLLGRPVRSWFGMDTAWATTALALLARAPGLTRLMPGNPRFPGGDGWLLQVRDQTGPRVTMTGNGQSAATADVAARAVELVTDLDPGVHHLPEVTTLTALDVPHRTVWH
ncbi:NAD-dependent epimerase/dehydratase family protein [Cellulomonas taurus]|uniref:NAD-dependent epimerase/dehydratase family protein n=1 Tax=Cellulomonas taurus TaxID=2729175 RepID=UPI00145C4814|nr:NAD-dependent epimerase/dehydratase family protein [Cellulomonas taurus]